MSGSCGPLFQSGKPMLLRPTDAVIWLSLIDLPNSSSLPSASVKLSQARAMRLIEVLARSRVA